MQRSKSIRRRACCLLLIVLVAAAILSTSSAVVTAQPPPDALGDEEFWRLTTELSEEGGRFEQQLMSNEDSMAVVIPALTADIRRGGIYLGVASEQNFTYLAALQPRLAFIIDIRRENLIELLMYKALFELSADRADFVSRLFSRPRPKGLKTATSAAALFAAFGPVSPDDELFEHTAGAIVQTLTGRHRLPIDSADLDAIKAMLDTFRRMGPGRLKGYGDRTNLTYAEMMAVTDLEGRPRSFLATEAYYRAVRALEQRNAIVGLTGDFAGDETLAGLGKYLESRHAVVDVFYVSNVERYLFGQGEHGRQFYRNVAALPLARSSLFIRSVTRDIGRRLGLRIPPGPTAWWTFLAPIRDGVNGVASGRIQTYGDLFAGAR